MICAALLWCGCEDEPPPMPRGGEPPAQEGGAAAAPAAGAPGAAGTGDPAAGAAGDATAPPKKKAATRVPTASELMGYGKAGQGDKNNALPGYLGGRRDSPGPSPLFVGKSKKPGPRYVNMRTDKVPVSPLERKWRGSPAGKDAKSGAKKSVNILAMLDTEEGALFEAKEPKGGAGDSAGAKESRSDTKKFKLLLYKLNGQTGDVDVFERSFKSQEAHDAAERFAIQQGYQHKRPTVTKKAAVAKGATDNKAKDAKKKDEKPANKCPFKATFTEMQGGNSVSQSRCFPTQKALDQFMAQRNKAKAAAAKKAAPAPPKPAAKPAAKKSGADDSLAPAKLD